MISVEEAQTLIAANLFPLGVARLPLVRARGYVLAEDVRAPFDLPHWDNSAMDGFVVLADDTDSALPENPVSLPIRGVIAAGRAFKPKLKSGYCFQIFTGAPVPGGEAGVIPMEQCEVRDGSLHLRAPVPIGQHIRRQGEESKKGEVVLRKGIVVTPGEIGILASFGRSSVKVFRPPRVALVATGSELVALGRQLGHGQIFNSNLPMLESMVTEAEIVLQQTVPDDPKKIVRLLARALRCADVLILTGGVSVGERDFVRPILSKLGVREVLWQVSQKPGKPLYVGRRGKTIVFGLPGNPASVFTCFYEYVYPALRRLACHPHAALVRKSVPLRSATRGETKKALFLKARVSDSAVEILPHQGAHMLSSLKDTNGIAYIPAGTGAVLPGEKIIVDLLPNPVEAEGL